IETTLMVMDLIIVEGMNENGEDEIEAKECFHMAEDGQIQAKEDSHKAEEGQAGAKDGFQKNIEGQTEAKGSSRGGEDMEDKKIMADTAVNDSLEALLEHNQIALPANLGTMRLLMRTMGMRALAMKWRTTTKRWEFHTNPAPKSKNEQQNPCIAKAAKEMRIKVHPDKLIKPGMPETEIGKINDAAARVGQAAEILLDPVKRAAHDEELRDHYR
ncbi:hypothetical protein MMC30_001510, partial [Trapelia coarctata]|nr:hypothetical protein [Trapelia coarctata]